MKVSDYYILYTVRKNIYMIYIYDTQARIQDNFMIEEGSPFFKYLQTKPVE